MKDQPAESRRGLFGRPLLTATLSMAALIGAGLGGVALADRDHKPGVPVWRQPGASATPVRPGISGSAESSGSAASGAITLSATGDIIMGSAPDRLPADGGAGFFDAVSDALAADLVMGNLEAPLTGDTGTSKCGSPRREGCFAFRTPPSYAAHLKQAGFQLLNTANNHARDYGLTGYRNTRRALERQGLLHTGATDQITVVDVQGVKVAVLGFSSYQGANSLTDLVQADRVVRRAADQADLVVVQVHMGAEGSDQMHVRPGTEIYLEEDRGDPMKFSRTVIDAGADLVVGHGPHVLRGMEFYRERLIAYSLGNFAGGGSTLDNDGVLGYGGILKVSLGRDGRWVGGEFLSTAMSSSGRPTRDSARERGRKLVADLSVADFGASAARLGRDGAITAPS